MVVFEVTPFCGLGQKVDSMSSCATACNMQLMQCHSSCKYKEWDMVQALQVLYSEREVSGDVGLPRHWMRDFFLASLCLEVQENQEGLSRLQVPASVQAYCMHVMC